MLNFNDIANQKIEDVKPVPLPPVGTYRWVITKLPETREFQGQDGTPYQSLEWPVQAVAATDDVDVDAYPGKITDIRQRHSYMFNRNDEVAFAQMQNQVKRFCVDILKCADESMTLAEAINATKGQQFLAPITWAPDKKEPEIIRAQLGRPAPLD